MKQLAFFYLVLFMVSCSQPKMEIENIENVADSLENLMSSDIEMAKKYADSLIVVGSPKVVAEANYALGVYYNLKDSTETARSHFEKSLSWAINTKDTSKTVACYRQLAQLYRKSGLFAQTRQYFKTALHLATLSKDTVEMAKIYVGLQKTDIDDGQLESSKIWHHNFLKLNISGELAYVNEFLQISTLFEENNLDKVDSILVNLQDDYENMSTRSKATMIENKALLAIKRGRVEEGIKLMHDQLKTELDHSGSKTESLIYQRMSQAFEDYKQCDSALYYFKKFHEAENNLAKAENSAQFVRQQTLFEEHQKQAEIEIEANRQKQIKKTVIYVAAICLLALLIISYLIYKNLRQKTKQNKVLSTLNEQISKQKQEIVESIEYAKTIQTGFLPKDDEVKNADVYYSPKDIISGDFYFYHEHDGKKYYAVGDCTGHGVPGAMLTMLAHNKLTEVVEKGTSFEQILNELHATVKRSLGQHKHAGRDGFDLALVLIDGKKMQCALAGRPIYIVRKGNLVEVKPNKACIGGGEGDRIFNVESVDLIPNDDIYLFSDGVADQFGGEHGKKWMSKNFKDTLVKSNGNFETFKKQFEAWKGDNHQTDDVTVVRIRTT